MCSDAEISCTDSIPVRKPHFKDESNNVSLLQCCSNYLLCESLTYKMIILVFICQNIHSLFHPETNDFIVKSMTL